MHDETCIGKRVNTKVMGYDLRDWGTEMNKKV